MATTSDRHNMAMLVEGCQYGLSSPAFLSQAKRVVHFKLTDSSLKTIEDFLKKNQHGGSQPSIQFSGTQGIISIPVQSGDTQTFQFSVSNVQGDVNGSLDCVRQSETKHGGHLEMYGTMMQRICIRATSDVFHATKQKRVIAEEEIKKVCTKEIKPSGPNISRKKVTKIRDLGVISSLQSKLQQNVVKKSSVISNTQSSHCSHLSTLKNGHMSSTVSSLPSLPVSVSASDVSKPAVSHHSRPNAATKHNSGLYNMSYRDRVIHLLAIRPYKKPELLLHLKRDGIKEKDIDCLGVTLQQVATLNSRENAYHLAKYAFQEVRLDWPYYSDDDKYLVTKKLQSVFSASSPAINRPLPGYPLSSQAGNSVADTTHKVKRTNDSSEHQPTKKQRISHYDKIKKENRPVNVVLEGNKQDVVSHHGHRKENIEENDLISETPDYVRKYHAIKSAGQRQRYKHEFNKEYEEYRGIHVSMEKVAAKFSELELLMKQTSRGTKEYELLKKRICMEYRSQKNDPKYIDQKKKFEYLHRKLGFIKKLVLDFDSLYTNATL